MHNSMHATSPSNLKKENVVALRGSWLERSAKGMSQVFVNVNVATLACRPLVETDSQNFVEMTKDYEVYAGGY